MTAEEIKEDILNKIKDKLLKAAYDISFEIENNYETCIDAFYCSYTPIFYDRGYNLYNASSASNNISNEIICEVNHNTAWFQAGIRVSSSRIGDPYNDPADYVFERSYYYGIHGTIKTGGLMVVSPERLMDLWFDSFKNNIGSYIKKYF